MNTAPIAGLLASAAVHGAVLPVENYGVDSISTGNFRAGFLIQCPPSGDSGGHVFRNNAAIGNQGAGFLFTDGSATQLIRLRFNNIYGNLGVLGNPPDDDTTGCGLINQSGAQVSAIRNFWGQASGPGEDPGDLAGPNSGCDRGEGSKTDVAEFLKRPAPVAP